MKGIWKYSELLPPIGENYKLTLGEGRTPLVKSRQIGPMLGLDNLYFKLELVNPSGSYKDRFAACAVSNLVEKGLDFTLATSSGNTGSALAAYCSAAGVRCYLTIVDGAPSGKVWQMRLYGANILMVKDFGTSLRVTSEVFSELKALADEYETSVQISAYQYCPHGMAGVQTIAYEIAEAMADVAGHVFSPAGGGGLTLAIARGFQCWQKRHTDYKIPSVHCVQPIGNNTISGPLRNGLDSAREILRATTSISGLQVPNIVDGDEVIAACRATGGNGYTVSDESVFMCQAELATKEGIFCEPAGAVSLAGLLSALEKKEINKKDNVVCLVTGHGFKDPDSADKMAKKASEDQFQNTSELLSHIRNQISK